MLANADMILVAYSRQSLGELKIDASKGQPGNLMSPPSLANVTKSAIRRFATELLVAGYAA
jgi:hypothetical protein